jgi:uncharacterized protein YjbI with pentapeptide repeats
MRPAIQTEPLRGLFAPLLGQEPDGIDGHRANKFESVKGQCSDYTDASCNRVSFRWAKLFAATFGRTQLQGADFYGADLSRARFQGADLRGANLVNIRVSPLTTFSGCNLTDTILAGRGLERGGWLDVRPFYLKSWVRTLTQDLRQRFS